MKKVAIDTAKSLSKMAEVRRSKHPSPFSYQKKPHLEDEIIKGDELVFAQYCNDPKLYKLEFHQNKPTVAEAYEWPKPPEKLC